MEIIKFRDLEPNRICIISSDPKLAIAKLAVPVNMNLKPLKQTCCDVTQWNATNFMNNVHVCLDTDVITTDHYIK